MKYGPLVRFMIERHAIYLRRLSGSPPPWTDDPILRTYRFTNVYRELDAVTQWIKAFIRTPYADHPNLWFMLAIARQINLPETLDEIMRDKEAWPSGKTWSASRTRQIMLDRGRRGEKVYTSAYMLNAHGFERLKTRDRDKALFTTELVLKSVWQARKQVEPQLHNTLEEAHAAFLPFHGWGGFTAYEVVCDLRYTRYLKDAKDVLTWAHAGPGALRGLNRLLGNPPKTPMKAHVARTLMRELWFNIRELWPYEPLELREIEHSLCEFDKYERARRNEGRPKQKFDYTRFN